MKKMFFALAALVLAFTGCSQEEDAIQVSEKKAVKVVVNMDKPGFGEDTRAARKGWEEGDEVCVVLNNDFDKVFYLTYSKSTSEWKSELFFYIEDGNYYGYIDEDEDYNPGPDQIAAQEEYLSSLSSGSLKAIYCSSGINYPAPIPEDAAAVEDLTGIDIYSFAHGYVLGECIMTCGGEDGTYSVKDGELTLNITMKPQVAQFTIKNLSAGTGANTGKLADGGEVGVAGGNLVAYAGGTITTEGIMLKQVSTAGGYNACRVHPNADGISIYASAYGSNNFANDETYTFYVGDDYYRDFNCNTYKDDIYNGAAIIMDGPYTDGAASKWSAQE